MKVMGSPALGPCEPSTGGSGSQLLLSASPFLPVGAQEGPARWEGCSGMSVVFTERQKGWVSLKHGVVGLEP